MKIWSSIRLDRVPQIWKDDAKILAERDIVTIKQLLKVVNDEGLKNLSDATDIPLQPLSNYVDEAENLVARQKTLRRASVVSGFALTVVLGLSIVMLFIQAELLSEEVAANNAIAKIQANNSESDTDPATILPDVNKLIERFDNEAPEATVNLRLLAAALEDSAALEMLQDIAENPATGDYSQRYERYTEAFQRARALNESIDPNDPRIAYAHTNTARAWIDQANTLNVILNKQGDNNLTNIDYDIKNDIRYAQAQAYKHVALARIAPGTATPLLNRRTESLAVEVDAIPINGNAPLQQQLTALNQQIQEQQTALLKKLSDEHRETRELILRLANALNVELDQTIVQLSVGDGEPEEIVISGPAEPAMSSDCGFTNRELATQRLQDRCALRTTSDTISFIMTVENTGNGSPTFTAQWPAENALSCDVETVLAALRYKEGTHNCRLTFKPE